MIPRHQEYAHDTCYVRYIVLERTDFAVLTTMQYGMLVVMPYTIDI